MVNVMGVVFCSTKGAKVRANSTAKGELRCTACGYVHVAAARFIPALEPVSSKRKKFKKGKRPAKKKG